MSSEAILRFENISKNINRTEILKNINFEVERGEVVGIIGKNGLGKSTLINILNGKIKPDYVPAAAVIISRSPL